MAVVCTTDDPVDSLEHHKRIREEGTLATRVYPAFRPDKSLSIDSPESFGTWVRALSASSGMECASFQNFLAALAQRHDAFHRASCRLSDHGIFSCFAGDCSDAEAGRIFDSVNGGEQIGAGDVAKFRSYMMLFFGQLDAGADWTKQLHLGAFRNVNTRMFRQLGRTPVTIRLEIVFRRRRSPVTSTRWTAADNCPRQSFII